MFSRRANFAAALLLAVHAALLAWAATRHSPSIDEVGHMAAGLSHWQFGRFDLYHVNPPLVRLVATAPVALLKPATNWEGYSLMPGARSEFNCGEQFIAANGERSFWLFSVARWACIPFSLLGGYICFRWAGELYGAAGGLLALALWCFCPNVLAHAQMITPDAGATALGVAACYLFWRWLRRPSWTLAFTAGVVLGLAELTKGTFLVLYAVWPLAWLVWRATGGRAVGQAFQPDGAGPNDQAPARPEGRQAGKPGLRGAAQLALMGVLSLYVINLGYAFEDPFRPLGEFQFLSESLAGRKDLAQPRSVAGNRFAGTWIASLPVPLPANYVLGIDRQKVDFENGLPSYLRGTWKHRGWWYYYLYGLAIKVPLGTWALFVLAATVGLTLRVRKAPANISRSEMATVRAVAAPNLAATQPEEAIGGQCPPCNWRDEFVLLLPPAAILALVSSQTGFSHHLRYVLPIFPFLFIWMGRLGRLWAHAERHGVRSLRKCAVVLALAWSIGGSLWYFPHSLSYFNELAGGPLGGRWHLLDSNIDWGQDLLHLRRWLDDHPDARPLGLAYFGYFDPRVAGIEFSLPPLGPTGQTKEALRDGEAQSLGPQPGWYAISVMVLHGCVYGIPDGQGGTFGTDRPYFTYFQRFKPVARAGYSIYIYHLDRDEVDRVRRELGLRPLGAHAAGEAQSPPRPKPGDGAGP